MSHQAWIAAGGNTLAGGAARLQRVSDAAPRIAIGGSLAAPPLPHHRTYGSRIRRFGELSDTAGYHQGGEAERSEEVIRQGELERFAIAEPPWASWAAGGFRRHGRADTAVSRSGERRVG